MPAGRKPVFVCGHAHGGSQVQERLWRDAHALCGQDFWIEGLEQQS